MGRACNKAVTIAEILKRKMPLHQITSLSSCELIDIFEPLEEGLDIVESKRYVSCMIIILSKFPLDSSNKGYQVSDFLLCFLLANLWKASFTTGRNDARCSSFSTQFNARS